MTTIRRLERSARLAQAVVHGGTVYLAGQVGEEGAAIEDQTRQALAAVDRLLAAVGSDKSRILQATIWLSDMADFAAMNRVWDAWVDPHDPPARSTAQAALAAPGYKVEVTVVGSVD